MMSMSRERLPVVFLRGHVKSERVHPTTWSTKGWPLERVFHSRKMQEASLKTVGYQISTLFIASELYQELCNQCSGECGKEISLKLVRLRGKRSSFHTYRRVRLINGHQPFSFYLFSKKSNQLIIFIFFATQWN